MLKSLLFSQTYNSDNDNKNVETYNGGGSDDIGWWGGLLAFNPASKIFFQFHLALVQTIDSRESSGSNFSFISDWESLAAC